MYMTQMQILDQQKDLDHEQHKDTIQKLEEFMKGEHD